MSARQIGMVAALGGLGFAWRALGLIIPLYPPFVLDVRETICVIAAFAGGPWVGIGTGFLIGLPSAIPMHDVILYPLLALLLCPFVKTAWRWRGLAGYLLLAVVIFVAEAICMVVSCGMLAYVFLLAPFWPTMVATFLGGTYVIYALQEIIPLIICIKLFPEFMKPRWLWGGGETIE